MKEQIKKALGYKDRALDARADSDLPRALKLIDKAIDLLEELWSQKGEAIDSAGANASPDERDLVEALAETYGVKGGILRSNGDPESAVGAYDKGLFFEQHQARKVDNSYNLVQRLANRVLAAPHMVGATEWEVLSKDMWQELEKSRDELQRQGISRGNDPWWAADMVTVQLLLSPRDTSHGRQRAQKAYEAFEQLKPKARVYESALRALEDLGNCLEQVAEGDRSKNLNVIVEQLKDITKQVEDEFEKAKTR
jgi:tetratricopeptide (TPR) repeat protein